jgi:hypothetical protein
MTANFRFFDLPGKLQNQIVLHAAKEARPILLPSRPITRCDALSLLGYSSDQVVLSKPPVLRKSISVFEDCAWTTSSPTTI